MPLVSVEVGVTLKIGDKISGNNYFKSTIGIKDIDTGEDLASQLKDSMNVARAAFDLLYKKIDKEVEERLGESVDS